MSRSGTLFVTACISVLLAACAGSGVQPPGPQSSTQPSAQEPPPLDPAAAMRILTMAPASQSVPAILQDIARSRRGGRRPQSIVPDNGVEHSYAGLILPGGTNYSAIYAVHAVYLPDTQLTIPFPSGRQFTGSQELIFAPTTKMPDGGCLENGSTYFSEDTGQTFADFYVFDFCGSGGFVYLRGLDPSFERSYVRRLDDVPSYIVENVGSATATPQARWRTLIYNFALNRWDLVFTETGTSGEEGWSIFEYYFLPGQCPPALPVLQARQISLYDPASARWVHVRPADVDANQTFGYPDSCFSTPGASYVFKMVQPDWWWTVTSTGS